MSFALKVRNGCKSYSQFKVLDDFNLTVRRGQIYCLIGPSGAGKTTLFSCILGITSLDSGEISIFGHNTEKSRKLAQLPQVVGYMPQETSLVEELTVSENLNFFANLYEMSSEVFEERYEVLRNVLEIPDDTRRVANCSGGQKRRISLAIAIMCEPKLLFLDEPTVGVDPILREKIWKFLRSSVEEKQTTVIVTTHYINEAEQSDCVGMLRQGRLLIEDSPRNIYEKFNLDGLDDVFALLCKRSEAGTFELMVDEAGTSKEEKLAIEWKRKNFSMQRLRTLIGKEFIVLKRQIFLLAFVLLLPLLSMTLFGFVFALPSNLAIGIVNNELNCNISTFNSTLKCQKTNLSCRLIAEIESEPDLKVKIYSSFMTAWRDGKAGKLLSIFDIPSNFTNILVDRLDLYENFDDDVTDEISDLAVVHLDNTHLHMTQFLQKNFQKATERFFKKFLKECKLSERLAKITGVNFDKPIFGTEELTFTDDLFMAVLMGCFFMISLIYSCISLIHDRRNGSWNRELLSGVSIFEILLSHLTINLSIMVVVIFEVVFIINFTMTLENRGNFWLELAIMILVYLAGIFFGLFFSCKFDDYNLAVYSCMGITIYQIFMTGSVWPLEGMYFLIKPLAWIFPTVFPSMALKNMFLKGYFYHRSILLGFTVPILWILCSGLATVFILKKNKVFS